MSWEQKQLKDVAFVNMGQSPDSNTYNDRKVGLPFLQGCSEFGDKHPTPKVYCSAPLKKAPLQSVLISVRAPVGDLNIADTEYCIGRGLGSIIAENIEKRYLYYNMLKSKSILQQRAQGSTFDAINSKELNELSLYITTDPKEQKKIADILESVDNSIESTKKAIEKYKLVKQGMMQDLLTRGIDQNGKLRPSYEQAPELYKESKLGFIPKEWECEPAIKNICILNGGTPSTTNTDYWNGNIGWLSVDDFNTGNRYVYCSKKTITTVGLKNSSTTLLKKGMIIISARGTVGVIAQLGAELTFNQSCYGIDGAENFKNDFLYYCLKHNVWQTKKYSYGNVFDTITKDTFKDMHLSFPKNLKEQQQIADRLTAIDNKIDTEQTYLLKLQKIKQGLMQDLLTGKVRCKF